jgi:transposase-like protein
MSEKRTRRTYSEKFKKQMVDLHQLDKRKIELTVSMTYLP